MPQAELMERTDRPAYVRFAREAVEDKAASLAAGKYVAKDQDFALITPPYSKDVIKIKVKQWFDNMEGDVRNDRLPQAWLEKYKEAYRMFQNGQEMPVNGTAIRGWGVISPAQQEGLLRMNILTVEDLSTVNDEGLRRIGMGSVELKNKARSWLAQLSDKGPLTVENANLRQQVAVLTGTVETLQGQLKELLSRLGEKPEEVVIETAADLLDEPAPIVRRKRAAQ